MSELKKLLRRLESAQLMHTMVTDELAAARTNNSPQTYIDAVTLRLSECLKTKAEVVTELIEYQSELAAGEHNPPVTQHTLTLPTTTRAHSRIKVVPPERYRHGENFTTWCERFQRYVQQGQLEDADLFGYLLNHVDDRTNQKLRSAVSRLTVEEKRDSTLFIPIFEEAIYPVSECRTLRIEMTQLRQEGNEDVDSFAARVSSTADRAYGNRPGKDETCFTTFVHGIKDITLRTDIRKSDVKDFEEAVQLARKYEMIAATSNKDVDPFNVLRLTGSGSEPRQQTNRRTDFWRDPPRQNDVRRDSPNNDNNWRDSPEHSDYRRDSPVNRPTHPRRDSPSDSVNWRDSPVSNDNMRDTHVTGAPRSRQTANSNQRGGRSNQQRRDQRNDNDRSGQVRVERRFCWQCGAQGHLRSYCPDNNTAPLNSSRVVQLGGPGTGNAQ